MGEAPTGFHHSAIGSKHMRMTKPRILYASPNLPYPATSGGAQRSALFFEALDQLGDVDCIFMPAEPPAEESIQTIKSKCQADLRIVSSAMIRNANIESNFWGRSAGIFTKIYPHSMKPLATAGFHINH
jgi:hypothetical protein